MLTRPDHRGFMLLWAILCALGGCVRGAAAQEGHGWFVIDTTSKESAKRATILHLPPPDRLAPRGTVRVVQGLTRSPERLAWSGNTVFVLMPAEQVAANERARRVYTISTSPGLMSGWEYIPQDRPESLPTLGGKWGARDMEVVGFAATPSAPSVLIQRAGGEHLLLYLAGTEWVQVTLPWDADGAIEPKPADRCRLITAGEGFGVLVENTSVGEGTWYVASPKDLGAIPVDSLTAEEAPAAPAKVEWTPHKLRIDPPKVSEGVQSRRDTVYCIENQLVRLTFDKSDATLSLLKGSDEFVVTTITDVGQSVRVAPSEGNPGFLAILSANVVTPPPAAAAPPSASTPPAKVDAPASAKPEVTYRLIEVTPSGRILYDGVAKQGGPVSVREIQILSVLLVMVMAAVVVFVLRPDKTLANNAIALPPGCIPAESGRRVMATVVDLGAAWIVASLIVRLDMADLARPDVLLGTPRGMQAALTALAVTIGLGTVLEWQFSTTIGKMLLGCRVLSVHEVARQPSEAADGAPTPQVMARDGLTLRGALWRNIGKWMPWNVVELLATGRQRPWADRISGTVVVLLDGSDQEEEGQ